MMNGESLSFIIGNIEYEISTTAVSNVFVKKEIGNVEEIIIPDEVTHDHKKYKVTSISSGAFSYSTNLKNVTISNSITSIGAYAFRDCVALENVAIPSSVITIDDYAFSGCKSLKIVMFFNMHNLYTNNMKFDEDFKKIFEDCKNFEVIDYKNGHHLENKNGKWKVK